MNTEDRARLAAAAGREVPQAHRTIRAAVTHLTHGREHQARLTLTAYMSDADVDTHTARIHAMITLAIGAAADHIRSRLPRHDDCTCTPTCHPSVLVPNPDHTPTERAVLAAISEVINHDHQAAEDVLPHLRTLETQGIEALAGAAVGVLASLELHGFTLQGH